MGHVSSERGLYSLMASEPIFFLEITSFDMAASLYFSLVPFFKRTGFFSSLRFDENCTPSNILGCVIFLFGLQRTSEILFPNNLILSSTYFHPAHSSQMVLTAAIGFMMMGILFMLWSKFKKTSRDIALLFVSSLVIFLGTFGIVIHLVPISIHEEFQKVLLHFYTSIGLFLIGFGFLIARFQDIQSILFSRRKSRVETSFCR